MYVYQIDYIIRCFYHFFPASNNNTYGCTFIHTIFFLIIYIYINIHFFFLFFFFEEQNHPSNVQCYTENRSSSVSQAGLVAFCWVQLLINRIRMKLFCCPHQSRQRLLEYWWPGNGLPPQLPSLVTEQRERGREHLVGFEQGILIGYLALR